MPFEIARLKQNPNFVCRGDVSLAVHNRQWFELPRGDGQPEAWCYTDQLSYGPGEEIRVFGIASSRNARLELRSDGLKSRKLFSQSVRMTWSETPEDASVNGCKWPEIAQIKVSPDWPSCVCRLVITVGDGGHCEHLVVIRANTEATSRAILLLADGTWNAYNDWGGSNHYEGIVDGNSNRFSSELSVETVCSGNGFTATCCTANIARECPFEGFHVLSAHAMGMGQRILQEVCFSRMGDVRTAFRSLD